MFGAMAVSSCDYRTRTSTPTWSLFGGICWSKRQRATLLACGGLVAFYLCRKHGVSFQQIAGLKPLRWCIRLIYNSYRYFVPQTLYCQVECYGQGEIHTDIVRKLNITAKPGAPLVLFVYQVSRETEDLRNALHWIEGTTARKKEDICAVVLLEKYLGSQNLPKEVANREMFDTNTVVVRILWKTDKILKDSSNNIAMAKVREKIMECQGRPTGGEH